MMGQVWFSIGPLDPGSWQALRDDEDLPDFMRFFWFKDWSWLMKDHPDVWFSRETTDG